MSYLSSDDESHLRIIHSAEIAYNWIITNLDTLFNFYSNIIKVNWMRKINLISLDLKTSIREARTLQRLLRSDTPLIKKLRRNSEFDFIRE